MSSKPNQYGEIDISLQPLETDTYQVELRVTDPGSNAKIAPRMAPARILLQELRKLQLQPAQYGEQLTGQLFADQRLREFYSTGKAVFDSKQMPFRLQLSLDERAPELSCVRWELLLDPTSLKPPATSRTRMAIWKRS